MQFNNLEILMQYEQMIDHISDLRIQRVMYTSEHEPFHVTSELHCRREYQILTCNIMTHAK